MKTKIYQYLPILLLLAAVSCTDEKIIPPVKPVSPVIDLNWQFESTPVWEDNFDNGTTPDAAKWTAEVGAGGWGNNELQSYKATGNATVENGNLVITAKKESDAGRNYTSARLISKAKGDWTYGRYEVRAKLPSGRGTWPAIWLLNSDNFYGPWPTSGEIDIMEHVGYDQDNVHCTIHTASFNGQLNTQKSAGTIVSGASTAFHTYRVDWTPYSVTGYVDDVKYFTYINPNTGVSAWPFNKNFFMILNIAVGGNWGGAQGVDDSIFPQQLVIDYVRVYKIIQ
ncbi:glycoside hydrolase family 16 protein [Limnovirga soli]|uniref:Family 16 glycosylhydrolase n=1 Tax=Limnovirga soli TaxID=2656915 RepID=A0A8J8FAC9_9BACT|nr:glycoside hydrolase family 16 protein [Limnovirga soli]NNV54100.1 family 16 glycosylhydrolase [Limnovirga soli]